MAILQCFKINMVQFQLRTKSTLQKALKLLLHVSLSHDGKNISSCPTEKTNQKNPPPTCSLHSSTSGCPSSVMKGDSMPSVSLYQVASDCP